MEFRDMLVKARKEKGYSQEVLAEKIGVSRQAVSKWETGDAQPALAQLIALADILDISLDVLCGRCAKDDSAAPVSGPAPSSEGSPAKPGNGSHPAEKTGGTSLKSTVISLMLGALIGVALMVGFGGSDTPESTGFPDTIEVTGLLFHGNSYRENVIDYEFVPSYVNPDLTYLLHFRGFDRQTHSFEVKNDNGIFSGSAQLPSGSDSYLVALEISDNRENNTSGESRMVALATGLCFEKGHASWNPVTAIVEP